MDGYRDIMFLKSCPKCGGDLVLDGDMYGRYFKCLQCGLVRDIADRAVAKRPARVAPDADALDEQELEAA
jgi:hypothetical protein